MDPVGIVIAALVGYSIFKEILKETPGEKAAREKAQYELERARIEEEKQQRLKQEAWEAQERERKRPFETAKECFQKQYVSYSRLSTYCSCPQRFKLIYLDKRISMDDDRFFHYAKGIVFHKSIENYLKDYTGETISNLDRRRIISEAYHLRYLENISQYCPEGIKEKIKRKRDTFKKNVKFLCDTFPVPVEVVAVEHELKFQINDLNFFGIVDLVLKHPHGHLEIVDYKTGTKLPTREQLEIYSIPFIKSSNHLPINFRVICVDRESHYVWRQNAQEVIESANNILGIVNTMIEDNSFMPAIGSHCKNCSVSGECKYSEKYQAAGIKKRPPAKRFLTRLGSNYEWKLGEKLPRSMDADFGRNEQKKPSSKRGRGLSFSLSKAKKEYRCLKTNRIIQKDEYHFVNHWGKRYCIDAFMELYPERVNQLIEEKKAKHKDAKVE